MSGDGFGPSKWWLSAVPRLVAWNRSSPLKQSRWRRGTLGGVAADE